MQNTIRLSGNYFLDRKNQLFFYDFDDEIDKSEIQIGKRAILGSRTNIEKNGKQEFFLHFNMNGIGCNANSEVKRVSGWCGTTNGISIHAYGFVKIIKIRELKNGEISVTVKDDHR